MQSGVTAVVAAPPISGQPLDPVDERLLDDLSLPVFRVLLGTVGSARGIARDRARADGTVHPATGRYVEAQVPRDLP